METLSAILLFGCVIAIVAAVIATNITKIQLYNHNQTQQEQHPATTLARLDFEDAERELAKARLVLNIIQNSENAREAVLQKAQDRVEQAVEEWLRSLKQVLQLRRRNRSPSPTTKAIYDRFRPKINTVESN